MLPDDPTGQGLRLDIEADMRFPGVTIAPRGKGGNRSDPICLTIAEQHPARFFVSSLRHLVIVKLVEDGPGDLIGQNHFAERSQVVRDTVRFRQWLWTGQGLVPGPRLAEHHLDQVRGANGNRPLVMDRRTNDQGDGR